MTKADDHYKNGAPTAQNPTRLHPNHKEPIFSHTKTMPIKAILFDFMGTCLDWHRSITTALPPTIQPTPTRSAFAIAWRQAYFDYNAARLRAHQPPEDIDASHRNTLHTLLATPEWSSLQPAFADADAVERCITAWHSQPGWPDVRRALERLRDEKGYELFVHANGTTRLQLDLVRAAGLRGVFDGLFSSELLGLLKPGAESYEKCIGLLRYRPEECVMVAAHAYDVRGARAVGMRTVYVYRWTDDVREDQEVVRGENDVYLEGMDGLAEAIAGLD